MPTDRTQVGLPAEAGAQLIQLKEDTPFFTEEADVYRLSVAVALAKRVALSEGLLQTQVTTKFRTVMTSASGEENLPRLDSADRRLARLVELFYPDAVGQPYRYSQYLATIGISFLHGELIGRGRSLYEVISELENS